MNVLCCHCKAKHFKAKKEVEGILLMTAEVTVKSIQLIYNAMSVRNSFANAYQMMKEELDDSRKQWYKT